MPVKRPSGRTAPNSPAARLPSKEVAHPWAGGAILVVLLGLSWVIENAVGGESHAAPHWFYVPVLLAAVWFGPASTLATAVAAGLLAGPFSPADVASGAAQQTSDWVTRAVFFVLIGLLMWFVTEQRRRTEKAQRTSQARYRALVEQIPVVTYTESSGLHAVIFTSPQVKGMLGYEAEEFEQDPSLWHQLVHPDDVERVLAEDGRAAAIGTPFRCDYRVHARDGRWVWVRDEAVLVEGQQLWQGVWMDVTEQKNAEAALKDAEARYRNLVEKIPVFSYRWDARNGLGSLQAPYVSPQIESVLGRSARELRENPTSWREWIHPQDRERVETESVRCAAAGEAIRLEYRIFARDGSVVWLFDQARVIEWDSGGGAVLYEGVALDITHVKQTDEALRQSLEQLQRTDRERRRLLARLVDAQEEERRRIASDIHDDTIQKVSSLVIRLDMLRMDHPELASDVPFGRLLETAQSSIASLRSLMFELHPYSLEREGLCAGLKVYIEEQSKLTDAPKFVLDDRLVIEPPEELRVLLYRIAQEAVTNARKHARAHRVIVGVEQHGNGYLLTVADDGVGLTEAAGSSSPAGHLGMTAMRERAEMAGGSFEVQPGADAGTVIRVWVPGRLPATAA